MPCNNSILIIASSVQAAAAVVIAFLAFGTLWLNRRLAADNRRLVGAQMDPEVVVYVAQEMSESKEEHVYAIIENVGRGPAQNVSAELDAPGDTFSEFKFNRLLARAEGRTFGVRFLPQGDRAKLFLRNRMLEGVAGKAPPFDVKLRYESLRGQRYKKSYELDLERVSRGWNIQRG